jgi:hypothetical protein
MKPHLDRYPLAERKLLYRVLHRELIDTPELMDSAFLHELQQSLQRQAVAEGVDISDHGAWDRWLGNEPVACDTRMAQRRILRD